jgi:hypothetical protein
MGKLSGGILGPVKGKVGAVVGSVSGGQNIVKAMPASYSDKKSAAQLEQRSSFKNTLDLYKLVSPSVKNTNAERPSKHSAYNVFMKNNVGKSIIGDAVNLAALKISVGSLQEADTEMISSAGANSVDITWPNNANETTAFATDTVVVTLIREDNLDVVNRVSNVTRADGAINVAIPENWDGQDVYGYVTFKTADANKCSATKRVIRFRAGSDLAGSVQ